MKYAQLKKFCLALPGASANVQWGADLVFKVGGKMFAVAGLDARTSGLSFKTAPESFHILTQEPGIAPSRYLARAHWVHLDNLTVLPDEQLKAYLKRSHALVVAALPRKVQAALAGQPAAPSRRPAKG